MDHSKKSFSRPPLIAVLYHYSSKLENHPCRWLVTLKTNWWWRCGILQAWSCNSMHLYCDSNIFWEFCEHVILRKKMIFNPSSLTHYMKTGPWEKCSWPDRLLDSYTPTYPYTLPHPVCTPTLYTAPSTCIHLSTFTHSNQEGFEDSRRIQEVCLWRDTLRG